MRASTTLYKQLSIYCRSCSALLFKYSKGGSGHLIKIREHKIIENFTKQNGKKDMPYYELITRDLQLIGCKQKSSAETSKKSVKCMLVFKCII